MPWQLTVWVRIFAQARHTHLVHAAGSHEAAANRVFDELAGAGHVLALTPLR